MADKGSTEKIQLHITGMHCANCSSSVEKGLKKTPGIRQAAVNLASEKASIEYDPAKINLAQIQKVVADIGFGVDAKKSIFPVKGMT